ncbi:Stage 0 sporulation protein J [bioreactor metagenome]|uniref:Stage 0 sporulation protein J n=1 Tax=bioreactor metagenome TaxID=1076179 RepID=A0A645CYW4_9ZZZZ
MELGLIENLQREDLTPLEEALGYRTLIQEHGLTQEEAAQRVGKSRPAVANALRLLSLPEEIGQLLDDGALSAGHARALLALPGSQEQCRAAAAVVEGQLSVRQTEELVRRLLKPQKETPPPPPEQRDSLALHLRALEQDLSERYGRKVTISHGKKKGKLELEYYDENDLDLLLTALDGLRGRKEGSK